MTSVPRFNVNNKSTKEFYQNNVNNEEGQRVKISTTESINSLGFGHIPEQLHRKAVKKGFNFTIMVIGESGLGKSTFVNSLLQTDLYKDREPLLVANSVGATTKIVKRFIELDEKGVKLRLTIIDTPGFGDSINGNESWVPIEEYINGAFEHYFKEECGLNRKNIQDNRVHCCLYFVSSFGRGLKPLDVTIIRKLQHKINIVPVIAKADALTSTELTKLKRAILADVDRHQLDIYRLPECDSDEESTIRRLDGEIKACLPFAVIASTDVVESTPGSKLRGRQYPWGVSEVENIKHCDFSRLRIFLLKTHMQDLKDMTSDVLYENYRAKSITDRMSRRQNERQTVGDSSGSHGSNRNYDGVGSNKSPPNECSDPGFEAIVDPENLLLHKEEEIQRMKMLCEKLQDQLHSSNQSS